VAYLYRAIDQHGQVIDVLLSRRRELAAARRFLTRALRADTVPAGSPPTGVVITTPHCG
jgi:transposase-like protein